jgi:hypothetical protein
MLRFIGAVAVCVGLVAGALWWGGYWEGEASMKATAKGRQSLNDGISAVQTGVNDGLNSLKVEEKATE